MRSVLLPRSWRLLVAIILVPAVAGSAYGGLPLRDDCSDGIPNLIPSPCVAVPESACCASAWSAGISVTDPPKVVFTQEPSDLTICDCADNKEKQLHCRYEWLDAESATSWNRSLQVRWRKDGNLIPGESGQSLDPLRCADGKHGCATAAGGVYSCELLVSQPGMSGVLRSRPGRVNVVHITQLRTAVSAVSSSSVSEGSTVHLRCLFRAGDGSSVPLSLLNGRRITWTIHNKHAWHNKTVAIESTVGSLSSVGVFRKAITNNMDLTVVLLPDASIILPSVSQVQLDNAAVNCMLQYQVLRSGEGPVILQVTKQPGNVSSPGCVPSPSFGLSPPANVTLRVGSVAVLPCTSTGRIQWSVDGISVYRGGQQNTSVGLVLATDQRLLVQALQPIRTLSIACMVMGGSEGLQASDKAVTLVTIEGTPVMASQLSYTVVNVTQTSGQSVDLHCPVNLSKSWPLPTVDWYEFGTGDKLLNEHGVKLTVLKAGLYQCTASNSVGSAWHTFLVVTKGGSYSAMTQGNASFTYVPGFDFGLVATVEEDVRDVYVSFKSSNGDSSAFIFPCGATRRHGSSLVLHLHHLFAVRCNYTFGSLLSFHLCFMDHSCLIQYSFNTGSPCLFSNRSLSATNQGLSISIPSLCQANFALISLVVVVSKCVDTNCLNTEPVGRPIEIVTLIQADEARLNVTTDRIQLPYNRLWWCDLHDVRVTLTTLNGISKLYTTVPAVQPYPHGQVASWNLSRDTSDICTAYWSCRVSWKMPSSSVWTAWNITQVSVAIVVRSKGHSNVICVQGTTSYTVPHLRVGVTYSFSLGLTASSQCVSGQSNVPCAVMTEAKQLMVPAPPTQPTIRTGSPAAVSLVPTAFSSPSNTYDLKYLIASGAGGLIVGVALCVLALVVVRCCSSRPNKKPQGISLRTCTRSPGRYGNVSSSERQRMLRSNISSRSPTPDFSNDSDEDSPVDRPLTPGGIISESPCIRPQPVDQMPLLEPIYSPPIQFLPVCAPGNAGSSAGETNGSSSNDSLEVSTPGPYPRVTEGTTIPSSDLEPGKRLNDLTQLIGNDVFESSPPPQDQTQGHCNAGSPSLANHPGSHSSGRVPSNPVVRQHPVSSASTKRNGSPLGGGPLVSISAGNPPEYPDNLVEALLSENPGLAATEEVNEQVSVGTGAGLFQPVWTGHQQHQAAPTANCTEQEDQYGPITCPEASGRGDAVTPSIHLPSFTSDAVLEGCSDLTANVLRYNRDWVNMVDNEDDACLYYTPSVADGNCCKTQVPPVTNLLGATQENLHGHDDGYGGGARSAEMPCPSVGHALPLKHSSSDYGVPPSFPATTSTAGCTAPRTTAVMLAPTQGQQVGTDDGDSPGYVTLPASLVPHVQQHQLLRVPEPTHVLATDPATNRTVSSPLNPINFQLSRGDGPVIDLRNLGNITSGYMSD